jgi:hypothetical protein
VSAFEEAVREWTRPINGQYARPWMSTMKDPTKATTFIVGRNQATPFPVELVGSQEMFLDAIFNRNGQGHAALYERIRARMGNAPSPARTNIERLTALLGRHGVRGILETNVICYSSPMSADLQNANDRGGKEAGMRVFTALLRAIRPRVIIAHGTATRVDLEKIVGTSLPKPPQGRLDEVVTTEVALPGDTPELRTLVFVIPALAPPGWKKWSSWAPSYLEKVAKRTAEHTTREVD